MHSPIYNFFTNDHRRLESILESAIIDINQIDLVLYHEFRVGILTHIKMEEKILFIAAQKANKDVPIHYAPQLRLEHGAITSLMVVPPTQKVIKVLKHVLAIHDEMEERNDGMYELCETLTQAQTNEIMEQLKAVTMVPVHPFNTADYALEVAKRALLRAGYDFDKLVK